jgi:hypothetical protein
MAYRVDAMPMQRAVEIALPEASLGNQPFKLLQ